MIVKYEIVPNMPVTEKRYNIDFEGHNNYVILVWGTKT